MTDNISRSHAAHEAHMHDHYNNNQEFKFFHIKNKDCVSYQTNIRSLNMLSPFWTTNSTWLTVGDYNGLEANFLFEKGIRVTASDISDVYLSEAKNEGLIDDYSKQNVENLSYLNESFDYVMCREAFHHFPRAYLGLYEMMRVSKFAAIIVEPIDILSKMPLFLFIKNITDRINPLLINKIWKNRFSFETSGNYVFKIGEREIEKMAMGAGLPMIAFKSMNVIASIKEYALDVPMNKSLYNKLMRKIKFLDILNYFRIIPANSLVCVVFKKLPDAEVILKMKKLKYKIISLPANPYLK
jgi:2-polyprenyl-3-methyl-5-hydroxy-6-metoxy-1,4-benzoquinol methylase